MSLSSKNIIAKKFSQAANNYDSHAIVQKLSTKKLVKLLKPFIEDDSLILDLGSGTSFIAQELPKEHLIFETDLALGMLNQNNSNKSDIFKIQSDFENLPFKDSSFDILTSSFSLQWITDFNKNLSQFFTVLKSGGFFALCLPIDGSLCELKSANIFNINEFPEIKAIKSAIKYSGFEEVLSEQKISKQDFNDGIEAIKSLKEIGANHANGESNKLNKTSLEQFNNFCLKNFITTDRKIRISWNVAYFILRKP